MPSILITGVSSGIGRACANLYAARDWCVVGTVRDASRPPEALDDRVVVESLDLAVPGNAAAVAQRVMVSFGCPDVLLSNAGVVQFGAIEDVTAEELTRIFQVNFFGQVELIRALLPVMRERRSGVVANVTSLGGTMTFPFFGAYNSTKWAFEGISEGLWHELKPFGIRVKAIEPGYVQTAIWNKALPGERADAPDEALSASAAYRPFLRAMLRFEAGITDRSTPEVCAEEIATAIADDSDHLRYPVAAYARPISRARQLVGAQRMMRFFHKRWMGPDAG
ncbi:MAG: SDR family oxidoreductase [Coriobacteriia bacterium]|nr:SDR family oxidoreductase [Coriobacteriia bacterium]